MTHDPLCANCGERLWRTTKTVWLHRYTAEERCKNGKWAMPKREQS